MGVITANLRCGSRVFFKVPMSAVVLDMLHVAAEAQHVHGLDPEPHGGGGNLPHVHPTGELSLLAKYEANWSKGLAVKS